MLHLLDNLPLPRDAAEGVFLQQRRDHDVKCFLALRVQSDALRVFHTDGTQTCQRRTEGCADTVIALFQQRNCPRGIDARQRHLNRVARLIRQREDTSHAILERNIIACADDKRPPGGGWRQRGRGEHPQQQRQIIRAGDGHNVLSGGQQRLIRARRYGGSRFVLLRLPDDNREVERRHQQQAQQRHQQLFGAALPEALGNGESPSFGRGSFSEKIHWEKRAFMLLAQLNQAA